MNMTIVIISRRSLEFVLLLALAGLALSAARAAASLAQGQPGQAPEAEDELPETLRAFADQSRELDEETLSSIARDLGKHFSDTMSHEMDQLLSEIDDTQKGGRQLRETQHKRAAMDEAKLRELAAANQAAGEDIRARIEMVGDNSGKLPQMSFGSAATSLLSAARSRLTAAGSFIGTKMRTLSAKMADKLPPKLKRFFRWQNFFNFKVRFHKHYGTLREELYRNFIFLKNQIVVNMQHIRFITRRDSHVLGQTQYSDMTPAEYREAVANKNAGGGLEDIELGEAERARLVARMDALAEAKRTVHGQPLAEGRPRKKRAAFVPVIADDDEDELNATEDEELLDESAFGLVRGSQSDEDESDDDDDDLEAYKLVDEFAGEADLSDLDDITNDIDEVLEPTKFQPIDLRETGCVIKPENQNNCGCCYAHMVTALVSYHDCMAQKPGERSPRRFHARFVSDCGRYIEPADKKLMWVNGCNGGRLTKALAFVRAVGIPLFMDYNIAQVSAGVFKQEPADVCAFPRPSDISNHDEWPMPIERFEFLTKVRAAPLNLSEVNMHLRTIGPVLVNVRLWPDFEQYDAGVYDKMVDSVNGPVGFHSMLIVGHDYDSKGREIYIIWNSHSIVWGERGFLKITAEALGYYAFMFVGTLPEEE